MDMLKEIFINYLILVLPIIILSGLLWLIISNIQKQLFNLMGNLAMILIYPCVVLHELAHMVMAILFTFRVTEVKLFRFDISDGTLGYVVTEKPRTRFTIRKLYLGIGEFFVGIAPVLLGGIGLVYLTKAINKNYFTNVLENPKLLLTLPLIVILIIVAFNFSMFFLSDLDFKSVLRGLPYLTVALFGYLGVITYFTKLNWLLQKTIMLQSSVLIILSIAVLVGIAMYVILFILNMLKRVLT